PHIFDRFYRAAGPPPRPGSGLGLAIVTAIAAAHQGTAEAALNHPHGLRIPLALPAGAPSSPAAAAAASMAPGSRRAPALLCRPAATTGGGGPRCRRAARAGRTRARPA